MVFEQHNAPQTCRYNRLKHQTHTACIVVHSLTLFDDFQMNSQGQPRDRPRPTHAKWDQGDPGGSGSRLLLNFQMSLFTLFSIESRDDEFIFRLGACVCISMFGWMDNYGQKGSNSKHSTSRRLNTRVKKGDVENENNVIYLLQYPLSLRMRDCGPCWDTENNGGKHDI